ncbi:hypothetical protein, partial [Catellatospora bangladeshensis]|uniref:hypothetical protein n=1 Tax=Catellatospora bangladeshensis TaxID=310355 RepID=UPI0019412CFE
ADSGSANNQSELHPPTGQVRFGISGHLHPHRRPRSVFVDADCCYSDGERPQKRIIGTPSGNRPRPVRRS